LKYLEKITFAFNYPYIALPRWYSVVGLSGKVNSNHCGM